MPDTLQDRKAGDQGPGRSGLAARNAAVKLLEGVLREGRPLDAALSAEMAHGALRDLSPRDRALARAIVAGALRRKGQLEEIFRGFLDRPPKSQTGALMSIVLGAMSQILVLGMPGHAVVDIAVEQCKARKRTRHFAGLVNAVLRRVAASGGELMAKQDAPRLNTPDWLWERWSAAYGAEAARAIAETHLTEPPLDVTVTSDADGWAERLGGAVLETGGVRFIPKGRIEALPGFDEGAWWVQDLAAALPVRLLGDVAGQAVADLCAAPGGKTAQLAAAGARVIAVDNARARLKRLRANLKRLSLKAEIVTADAGEWRPETALDAVLLDAPCSATGTIRRHPDILQVKRAADIAELVTAQARLLDSAAAMLRPGGRLVYAVCSLEPEEGEAQIAALLERSPGLVLDPIAPAEVCGREDWLTGAGCLRTLPHYRDARDDSGGGMDGFFAARLLVPG